MKKICVKNVFVLTCLLLLTLFFVGCGGSNSTLPGDVNTSPQSETEDTTEGEETQGSFENPISLPHSDSDIPGLVSGQILVHYRKDADPLTVADALGGNILETFSIGEKLYCTIGLPGSASVVDSISSVASMDEVVYAEPVCTLELHMVPDDIYYDKQYAPQICNTEAAWDITTGGEDITIAIVDTGVNGLHKEFEGKMVPGYDANNNVPLTGYENSDTNTGSSSYGHGTHVAGIAAASGNNSLGIAGVAWNCKIMPVKVYDPVITATAPMYARAITWAADNGANVINMSFGGHLYIQVLQDAISYALENNVTVVGSMGNSHIYLLEYPSGFPGVIAVGSIDGRDEVSSFSTRGDHMSVTAPGSQIYSTFVDGEYAYKGGTSMSAPFVSGVCALILSAHPGLTPEEVKSQLETTATDLGTAGFDPDTGWGKPDVEAAVGALQPNKYGRIFVDTSANRHGATIVIYDTSNNVVATTRADEDGYATFYNVPEGTGYVGRLFDTIGGTTVTSTPSSFSVTAGNVTNISFNGMATVVLLKENFDGGTFPPTGWVTQDLGGTSGVTWETLSTIQATVPGRDNLTGGTGECADADDEAAGAGVAVNTELRSPQVVLPAGGPYYTLYFRHYFADDLTLAVRYLEYSDDAGSTWYPLLNCNNEDVGIVTLDLSTYAGETVIFRWRYDDNGSDGLYWQIDDVFIQRSDYPAHYYF